MREKVWFTSDTHFGSKRTLELSKRPFKTVEEMNKVMVDRWNEVVSKNDVVYHIGDFGDYSVAEQLNGKIKLVLGNYDMDEFSKNPDVFANRPINMIDIEFECTKLPCVNQDSSVEFNLILQHEPLKARQSMKNQEDAFALFGHIHKLQMVKQYGLNVGVDCHNFYPIDMNTVRFYKDAIEKHYDENVFK